MTKVYYQLNFKQFNTMNNSYPLDYVGYFSDGIVKYPLFLPLLGFVLMESDKPVMEADAELLILKGWKKLPNDVVFCKKDIDNFEYKV